MPPTKPRTERQEGWKRGEVKAVEAQAVSLDSLVRSENWERDLAGDLISSPGFKKEFNVPLHRQIADMEDAEDARWAGDVLDDIVNSIYGFQSRQHQHGGAGTKTSTFTRSLAFLGSPFNGSTDQITMRLRADDVSELVDVEVRFRELGGDYFHTTISPSGWTDGVWETEDILQSAFLTSGTPEWDKIIDMHIITESAVVDAGGVVNLGFDNFFIARPADTVGEPIWDILAFERISTPERYLMVSSGSEIYSYVKKVQTKRQTNLDANRQVDMIVANDMVIASNGSDNIKRWDAGDVTFRDLGVPIPANTITGAEAGVAGAIAAGTYFFVTVFGMGKHGEGNSIVPATQSVTIASGPDRINYANVPIGPPGTEKRLVYRTVDGGGPTGPLLFDVAIDNNVDTTVQSNISDANLGATLAQDGDQPLVGSMLIHANRTLFLAGVAGFESSVFYSDTTRAVNRTIEQWPVLNEFRLNPSDGDRITGMAYSQRFIYIFKRRSTWILDPINLGQPVMIDSSKGSMGHLCLVDAGTVLFAWSDEHGPLAVRGQTVTPIGILESNLEREGPRVGDVNGNVPETGANVLGSTINTQDQFENGTLTDTVANEVVGSVVLDRHSAPGFTMPTNLGSLGATTGAATASSSGGTNTVANVSQARDGILSLANQTNWTMLVFEAGNTYSGTYTLTFDQPTNVSRVRTWMSYFKVSTSFNAPSPNVEIQYQTSGGAWITVNSFGVFDDTASPTNPIGDFLRETSFTPVVTQRVRINFTWAPDSNLASIFLSLYEFQVFETGYLPAGSWRSGAVDLLQIPANWGRFNAATILPSNTGLQFFMRSAPTADFTGIDFVPVAPGIAPDTTAIPLNQFVEWQAVFTSSANTQTPRLDDLSILFTSAAADFVRPRFQSAGVIFDRRYWLSSVLRDQDSPTLVWKYQQLLKSWSRHPGFNVSSWTKFPDELFSGSSATGDVYRNVIDELGKHIGTHDGTNILCVAETKDSPFSGQDRTSTVLETIIACRNESKNRSNLIRNSNFEEWGQVPSFLPGPLTALGSSFFGSATPGALAAWEFEGVINFGQGILRETEFGKVVSGLSSAKISWTSPALGSFAVKDIETSFPQVVANNNDLLMRHDVSLLPDQDYFLTYYAVRDDQAPINIFRIQDFRSDGAHEYLRNDGTWGALVDEFLGDNAAITEAMEKHIFSFRTNVSDPNHVFYRIQFGYLISTNTTKGATWIDDVTLYEATEAVPRYLRVIPILDGQEDLPERRINLTGENDGTFDVGVRRKQFRIDRALIKNGKYRLIHEEPEAQAKVMGIYTMFTPEELRQD